MCFYFNSFQSYRLLFLFFLVILLFLESLLLDFRKSLSAPQENGLRTCLWYYYTRVFLFIGNSMPFLCHLFAIKFQWIKILGGPETATGSGRKWATSNSKSDAECKSSKHVQSSKPAPQSSTKFKITTTASKSQT